MAGNKIISIPYRELRVLLSNHLRGERTLPADYEIISIGDNFFCNSLDIKIEDPTSPAIEAGATLPRIIARF